MTNPQNVHRHAVTLATTNEQHLDPSWSPQPQFWVAQADVAEQGILVNWSMGFKDVTAPTNVRTMIAAIVPVAALGNTLPAIFGLGDRTTFATNAPWLLANLNSIPYDYLARQKVQGQHLNWFIVEQLPLIAPVVYEGSLGDGSIGDFVRGEVLRLSYTAQNLAPFARDLGYDGPLFVWDAENRRHRMARLDALYFRLYGLDRDEAAYVMGTFPIVRDQDQAAFGRYRTRDLVLGYMNALAAGDTTTMLAL